MKLTSNPTVDDLRALFSQADDSQGHHVLWVSGAGDVHLTCLPDDIGPIGFEQSEPSMKLRYETFQQGNDYVGAEAATDDVLMGRLFDSLVKEWPAPFVPGKVRYIDYY